MSDTQDIGQIVQGGFEVLKWSDLSPEEQDWWVKLAWVFSAPPDDDGPGLVSCLDVRGPLTFHESLDDPRASLHKLWREVLRTLHLTG